VTPRACVIRNSYVDTAIGQLHLRELGSGRPIVLLHWGPATGAQYRHVMPPRLDLPSLPALCLTAEREPLRVCHERGLAHLKNGRGHVFPGGHPLHDAARAAEYAGVVAAFLTEGA
jgi:hypothetical protein